MNHYESRSFAHRTSPPQAPMFVVTSSDYRRLGVSFLGSVALCAAWKEHRVLGFFLGGMVAGAAYNVVSPPGPTAILITNKR